MTLTDLETEIRELINGSEFLQGKLGRDGKLNLIWSALDIIDDTEVGVGEYFALSKDAAFKSTYLIVFGVLQLLQVQQDAVRYLCSAIGVPFPLDPSLKNIREIRNCTIGHPVYRESGPKETLNTSSLIVRGLLSKTGFIWHTYSADRNLVQQSVNIPKIIDEQHMRLSTLMEQVFTVLQQIENKYREGFKEVKFAKIFHGIPYIAQKLVEATISENHTFFGSSHVRMLYRPIEEYEEEVQGRGLSENLLSELPTIRRALNQLTDFFAGRGSLNGQDAYIYADYLERQIGRLIDTAKNLDQHFEETV